MLLEQREAFKERQVKKKEQAKARVAAEQAQRRHERAVIRSQQRAERAACETWASANRDKISKAIDETSDALEAIEEFGMIGEDDPALVPYLAEAYGALADAFIPGQRACVNIDENGADEILDREINKLLAEAERSINHICERQYNKIDHARADLTLMSDFLEKASRGIYEPP
jgi:hypothetical protein